MPAARITCCAPNNAPSAGALGVVGVFVVATTVSFASIKTVSVNVPPISLARRKVFSCVIQGIRGVIGKDVENRIAR